MPGGGLMQLLAYGAADIYLTGVKLIKEDTSIEIKKNQKKSYFKSECDICLEQSKNITECGTCVFHACNKCYNKMSTISNKCPQCKRNFNEHNEHKKYSEDYSSSDVHPHDPNDLPDT